MHMKSLSLPRSAPSLESQTKRSSEVLDALHLPVQTSSASDNAYAAVVPGGSGEETLPFRLLFEAAAVPIIYKNLQGIPLGCNQAFESFFGLTKQQVIGKPMHDILPNHLAELVIEEDQLLIKKGNKKRYEARLPDAEGTLRDVLINKTVIKNSLGEALGLMTVIVDISDRKQAERHLVEALEFAEGIITAIPDTLFEADREGRYLNVWTKNANLLAQQKAQLLGKTVNEVLPADQAAIAMEALREADAKGSSYGQCLRIPLPSGETRWFELSVAKKPKAELTTTFLVLSRDITERRRMEEAFSKTRAQLVSVLRTIPDMVWLKDLSGRYLLCNHAFERMVGRMEPDIVGKTAHDLFDAKTARSFREKDLRAMGAEGILIDEGWMMSHETGQPILLETRKLPVFGSDGEATGLLSVGRDITELSATRQKIDRMAYFDALTSLPNRTLFHDRLLEVIADAKRCRQAAGIILLDLDRFKSVNDTMGHPSGDELLRQVGVRLTASVRNNDIVARLGGDEFAILLPALKHHDDLRQVANRILDAFSDPFLLEGCEIFVACSMGIAVYPNDSMDANDLVKYADSAMYLAKRSGRGSFRFYTSDLTRKAQERLHLESELRHAIERGELELHYQPKVRLEDSLIIGSEALLRWRHPEMGVVPPDQFIGIAEETKLITEIGRWVLREACRTAAELNDGKMSPHKVAINLSAKDFQCKDLPSIIAATLRETCCHPEWIEIEITESLFLGKDDHAMETLSALQSMGITIAIDDFGTGYSALSYMTRFKIDTLKIDRSFISSADARSAELVKAILSFARCLGQHVVAEGVETHKQAAFLATHGCHAAQGFLYSKPLSKADFMAIPRHVKVLHRQTLS
jgi:diguanylate cyclase (GGDEF)-like protein/PAS domain S-box-containing protein